MCLVDFVAFCRFLMILGSLIVKIVHKTSVNVSQVPRLRTKVSLQELENLTKNLPGIPENLPGIPENLPGLPGLPGKVVSASAAPTLPSTRRGPG